VGSNLKSPTDDVPVNSVKSAQDSSPLPVLTAGPS